MRSLFSLPRRCGAVWCRIGVAAALGLVLAACQQAATPADPAPDAEPERHLSRDVAAGVAGSMQVDNALGISLRSLGDPLGGLRVATVDGGAVTEMPDLADCLSIAGAADSDGDGYPAVAATLDLDCQFLALHIRGTVVLEDKDDTDRESGFRSEVDFRSLLVVEDQEVEFGAGKQAMDVDAIDGGDGYGVSLSSEIKVLVEEPFLEGEVRFTYAGHSQARSGAARWPLMPATARSRSSPFRSTARGWPAPKGQACRDQAPDNPTGTSLRLAVNSTGIVFDKESCATAITEGSFDVRDEIGNVLGISYDGCGERSATYNGEPLPLPTPEG